jgi:predicted MFS family arabinose efflux permease
MSSAESVLAQDRPTAAASQFSRGYRGWLLFLLLVGNALNLADRQGIAAVAPAFKAELHLTDGQLGILQGLGFAIFYTLFSLPLAILSDRMNRARIIAACITLFGSMVALCGISQNFWQMLLFRIGVGSGDAGFVSPVASLIGDHYPPNKRTSAMTVIWLGAPIGAVTGSVLGGWFAQNLGWRNWFLALSVPALALAVIAFLTLREPVRGMSDPGGAPVGRPPSPLTVLRFLLGKRSFVHVLTGAALAATGMNAIGQFLARFIVSTHHVGFAEAGRILGTISGVSMASGLAIGGFGMDWMSKFDRRWYVWGPAIGLCLATPLFMLGFAQAAIPAMIGVLICGHVALFVYYTPTLGMAQNMVGPSMRGSSGFVVSLVLGLVGVGLGPTVVGFLSDFFAQQAFPSGSYTALCPGGAAAKGAAAALDAACRTANASGIRNAVMAAAVLFVWAALHYLLASRRLRQDLDTQFQPQG